MRELKLRTSKEFLKINKKKTNLIKNWAKTCKGTS